MGQENVSNVSEKKKKIFSGRNNRYKDIHIHKNKSRDRTKRIIDVNVKC